MKNSTKDLFDKRYRYSIRRLSVGAASVVVGCLLFGGQVAAAQSVETGEAGTAQPMLAGEEEGSEVASDQESPQPVVVEKESKDSLEATAQPAVAEKVETAETDKPAETEGTGTERSAQAVAVRAADDKQDKEVEQANSPETWQNLHHVVETDQSINFDKDWKFHMGEVTGADKATFDDTSWKTLDLPHDFSLNQDYSSSGEAESGYKLGGVGWYRKEFTVSEEVAKGRVELQFDGSYMETEVFVNGQFLGMHPYGYSPFTFDLTSHIRANEANLLAVKVTNRTPSSRWYSGSGIYRSIHLNTQPQTHIEEYGVVVKTPTLEETYKKDQSADVQVTTKLVYEGESAVAVKVVTSIFERKADGSLSETALVSGEQTVTNLAANSKQAVTSNLKLTNVKLWSPDSPQLYVVRTEVYQNGQKVQSRDQETGFRYIHFDKDKGFLLNGQNLKLQGVCMHHDQGSLGAQTYYDAVERQFDILKEMGVNAVRVTHNPASRVMKDIANRKGMLLVDEAFDTWEHAKNSNVQDYARFFNQQLGTVANHLKGARSQDQTWSEYHIKQMVRSGINDPSIIMWSTGNEVLEGISGNANNYAQVISKLINWVKEEDSSRPTTLGDNKLKHNDRISLAMGEKLHENAGLVGFNYADGSQYDAAHRANPNWIIYGSETASSVNSRGVYNVKGNDSRRDRQLTSYDQSKVGWGHFASQAWYDAITRDFVAGEFVWTGFDYLGEPTPWNGVGAGRPHGWPAPKSSYFGIVDTAGFPKDSYYFYRSQWNQKDTTLHVLPAWREDVVAKDAQGNVEVVVYSNASKVKLVHIDKDGNQTSYGEKTFDTMTTAGGHTYKIYNGKDKSRTEHQNLYLIWKIPYKEGTIKAIAYDEKGMEITNTVGSKELSTFGPATKLVSKISKKPSKASDHSLAYIEIDVQDADGNLVINADKTVTVTVSGPAELVAMDNGNPMDHQSYQAGNRKAFGGKVLAIVKLTGQSGQVTVTASADGLTASSQTFDVTGQTETVAKKPVAYKLSKNIYLKRGAHLDLPTEILVRYSDGKEEKKAVTFDKDIQDKLKTASLVKAVGRVADANLDVSILVTVLDQVAAIQNVATAVERGGQPAFPATVQAYLADGQLLPTQFPVDWQMPEDATFAQPGLVEVAGTARVLGKSLPVKALVRVGDKVLTAGGNVAGKAKEISQDIAKEKQSDTLTAITDGNLTVSANTSGGANPTIWSNYAAAQDGKQTATLSFTYDTAQNIGEVVAYYHRDNWSLRQPKSVAFSWSRSSTEDAQAIGHTVAKTESVNGLTKVTYRLNQAVPAEVFKMTVENADENLGNRKTSVGLAELELRTVLENFEKTSDATINEIRIGNQVLTGATISKNMTVSGKGDVTARNTEKNVATTVLRTAPDTVKIFTQSEDGQSETYTLTFVADSPQTEGKNYISRREVTLSAGTTENRPGNEVSNANDFDLNSLWHSAWAGAPLDQFWLTADTGRLRQLNGLAYRHRQDGSPNGKVTDYEVYVSADNQNWKLVKTGRFVDDNLDWQEVGFELTSGRYVKLKALHTLGDGNRPDTFMSASEFRVSEFLGKLEKVSLATALVSLPDSPIRYTGQAQTPKPQVRLADTLLTEGVDYSLSYQDNVGKAAQDSQARLVITGLGRYEGQLEKAFTIKAFTGAAATDGTTETAPQFTAKTPASKDAIAKALKDAAYLAKEYQVLPVPHSVVYGAGLVALEGTINLVFGDGLDIYTRNRLKDALQASQISYKTSDKAEDGVATIYVGIKGQGSQAEAHQSKAGISQDLYEKIDAYSLLIKDGAISILGRDTDAAFHGLTTLKHLLKDSPVPVLREVKVEDYADVKNRGFIEGYYGNPWSNQDRMELMRYGGDIKLTQYFFAPKDDPYHNSQWRDLYPAEKLAEIREMARVGNQSKTRYVWTLHPFMHVRVRFGNESHYAEDLAVIKAKFTQLMDAGVREFGILADDAPTPAGGFASYNRLMADLTQWLESKQADYLGLRKEMVFVPHEYWGHGNEAELRSLNENLPASTTLTLTGGRIWGEVSGQFLNRLKSNLSAGNKVYRPVQLWINWPCTDNSKEHLILGGGEKFLHPNVDPSLIGGIMLNPMQQSEPSKIALFSAAAYTWNVWKSEEEARKINDLAFAFAETGSFKDTETSTAFRELGKHMINQNMDTRVVKLEESVELAPKLAAFKTKLEAGEALAAEREELRAEFAKLKAAAETYKANGHERMKEQISYWLDNTIDQMNALDALLTASQYVGKDTAKVWENYHKGLTAYEASKGHTFWYVNHYEKAELGVQHIRLFILSLLENLATEVENDVYPDKVNYRFISNRTGGRGRLADLLDGDLSSQVLFTNPTTIATGDYVGLAFDKPITLNQLGFAMGAVTNLRDTFTSAKIEYLNEQDEWVAIDGHTFAGNEPIIQLDNLNLKAKAVRLIATSDKDNTWLGIREIAVNRKLESSKRQTPITISHSNNLIYKHNTTEAMMKDKNDATEAMFADANGANSTPVDAWIQADLGAVKSVSKVRIAQGVGDKLTAGVVEYSTDGQQWVTLSPVAGEQVKELTENIEARYIRIRNSQVIPVWWRIKEFTVETNDGSSDLTDTNVPALAGATSILRQGQYDLSLAADQLLSPGQYIGLKLDRLYQLEKLAADNSPLTLLYSPNAVEWYSSDKLADQPLGRYIRLVNTSDKDQAIGSSHLLVTKKDIQPDRLKSTTMGINNTYGANDVRRINNLAQLFDENYTNFVEFADTPKEGGDIVLELGQARPIRKIRACVQDGTQNYLRDGKIQVSADGQTWTDVVTVGDGQANSRNDDSLSDGWTHDSNKPGNRYIEGSLEVPVTARYLRVYFTANYDHRFVGFTELVLNDGEFVPTVLNPTVEGPAAESRQNLRSHLVDGRLLKAYTSQENEGHLLYHLSEKTAVNHIKLVSDVKPGTSGRLLARIVEDNPATHSKEVSSKWIELGPITTSLQTFTLPPAAKHLLDVKIEWSSGPATFYELTTFLAELPEISATVPETGLKALSVELPLAEIVEEEIAFETQERENPELDMGVRRLVQEGQKGRRRVIVAVQIKDGQAVDRQVLETVILAELIACIVEVGSKPAMKDAVGSSVIAEDKPVAVIDRVPDQAPVAEDLPVYVETGVGSSVMAEDKPVVLIDRVPDQAPVAEDLPVFGIKAAAQEVTAPTKAASTEADESQKLPETGQDTGYALGLTVLGMLGLAVAGKRRKQD